MSNNPHIVEEMLRHQRDFNNELSQISFIRSPIHVAYNPTIYAAEPYERFLQMYCCTEKKIIFLGMNPGPFGMCQTGVPFGDVIFVQQWLQINGKVTQPNYICEKRRIQGFNCKRREISGCRFWNFFKELCLTPDIFFKNSIVFNYCPLAFMKMDGQNITPPEFKGDLKSLKIALEETCDRNLVEVVKLLKPEVIIGIGRYAEKRIRYALNELIAINNIEILYMPHPSGRSTQSKNWAKKAKVVLEDNNLEHYFQ
ncbi:hypothetical protein WA026_002261 [Henosepilachna vigintioctopunctata]|uniref:Uracil-DNA glycosylase-like domain-containing protein n=1 Tax=Henosepilachna vigintioctopunctata TaxID=420089 RepID=A0AAW1TZW9_9CUCU